MAKFIGVKMIEATPMRASMALSAGYKIVMLILTIWVMK